MPSFTGEPSEGELLFETIRELASKIGRIDVPRCQVQQLFTAISQSPAGGRVRIDNPALEVMHEDRVVDALEQGAGATVSRPIVGDILQEQVHGGFSQKRLASQAVL